MNPHRWKLLQIVNIGTFMSTLDTGIVQVALPSMAEQYGASLAGTQWVVTGYLLTLVSLLPLFGKWSDRTERRRLYGLGFLFFTAGSLLVACSEPFGLAALVAARCVQGAGAALIMANSQAMVRLLFPDHERGRALGVNAVVISLGTLLGPAAGGLLLEWTSWPVLFLINLPFGAVAAVCAWRLFPSNEANPKGSVDWFGSVLLAVIACTLIAVSSRVEQTGFDPASWGWIGTAGLLLAAFWLYERRLDHGILDPVLYRNRSIAIGNFSGFMIHLVQMAAAIPVTFYMQSVLGMPAGRIGGILALQALFMGFSAPAAGWIRDRFGAGVPVISGPFLCAVSTLWIVFGTIDIVSISAFLILSGTGIGLFQATNSAEIMSAAPDGKVSLVGSMLALVRYLGMAFGTGLAVLFVGGIGGTAAASADAYAAGMKHLFMLCGAASLLTAAAGFWRPRPKPRANAQHP